MNEWEWNPTNCVIFAILGLMMLAAAMYIASHILHSPTVYHYTAECAKPEYNMRF